jgi:hypothetical protein
MEIKREEIEEVVEYFISTMIVFNRCDCGEMPFLASCLGVDPPDFFAVCDCGKRCHPPSHSRRDASVEWNKIAGESIIATERSLEK